MIKRRLMKTFGLIATLALALVLSACGNGGGSSDSKKTSLGDKDVEIPYIASDNSTARSLVIAEVLKKAGYNVITTPVQSSGPLYASVSEDKDQFHADGIFPSTDKKYYNKFKNKITVYDQHHLISNVKVGLAVPKYEQDVSSIRDLKDKDFGKSVDWTIQGTDKRNGVMKQTKDEIGDNDLEKYSLNKSSDQDQFKKIQGAYKQQKPIVFTAMDPSWINKELDFKMLDDPDKVYGKQDQHIDLVFNKEFKQSHPGAYKIATRIADDWSKKDEEKLAKKIFVDNKNPEQTAKDYVDDHDSKVDDWKQDVGN
ncbi:glycine betaine ABC transporter substrate-binding protein [Staphylococcus kloosii]|jgi:glycine betaine/proline transport system substrate-binding protein|uniref:glycine betaine ABC transporter substrate-binding protein n=1 Tax=Staphylococcus kloosii TaxID=29384 RepID=UPI001E2CBC24|nr:glycine betaine ABC transporter substrate-binding protein [Staphylococcus kloosii]MCD8879422.1 ABC transporter substrate-binding protein [Staphylococcus kloosii]MDT3959000.1 glycine betaine ABC transporter substrate-binding protein [Staphylococcus kloosii]